MQNDTIDSIPYPKITIMFNSRKVRFKKSKTFWTRMNVDRRGFTIKGNGLYLGFGFCLIRVNQILSASKAFGF